MGFIGLFSYIGAAIQEKVSSLLIKSTKLGINSENIYDFDSVIIFWISASVISFFLSLSLWNHKIKD